MKSMTHPRTPSLFSALLKLTFFLIFLQILTVGVKMASSGIASTAIAKSALLQFTASPAVSRPLLMYTGTQILLQLLFACAIWIMARGIGARFAMKPASIYSLGIILWLFYVILIFVVNTLTFNLSLFSLFSVTQVRTSTLYLSYASLFIIPVYLAFTKSWRPLTALVMLFSLCHFVLGFSEKSHAHTQTDTKKPSIIIISIEAMRPEFAASMPFLNSLLNTSTRYTDAYTPIAQSFPSLISVLTSRTPLHQGARSLYTNYSQIDLQGSLLEKLHADGYQTVYAVDGQRFGEITPSIGFDNIISPPFGAAELLIGSISDFPLSNLLSLTTLGKRLFPYTYANRSIAVTYQPEDYINLLQTKLSELPNKPLFLVAHFSLSHWPYRWAHDNKPAHESIVEMYQRSLGGVDQQISAFYQLLENNKLLDHAILVMMSDHGIGLGLPGDSFGAEKKYRGNRHDFPALIKNPYSNHQGSGYDTSYNYSTNILSLRQYHTLLAFKFYGLEKHTPATISTRTSIMDITPTLAALLHLPANKKWDGQSLLAPVAHRAFFMENGFTTPEIAEANIDINRVIQASAQLVTIDSQSGLLSLTGTAQKTLLAKKERSLLLDDWMLARLNTKALVLVNIKSGEWTADLTSTLARRAPLAMLMQKFNDYNAYEI